ncbi:MAG: TrmH family RNA methyltransferase [Burkholderiales bacterium]
MVVRHINSRDNPLLKRLKKLAQDSVAYRNLSQVWLEGDHLCGSALSQGVAPVMAVFSASYWSRAQCQSAYPAVETVVVEDQLYAAISPHDSPAPMAFVVDLPATPGINGLMHTLVLDRVQDAGNVGSILRSAAAFGVGQVIALKGTAALWAPKVVRAGMGAHFSLHLIEQATADDLSALQLPLVVSSSHQGEFLQVIKLSQPCAWVFGHEGQGVSLDLMARAELSVRIAQPGGQESLNVAAAAAICLHASAIAALNS